MTDIRLATGVLERDGAILLVASRYPNRPAPLWHLPGGRPRDGELLSQALVREFAEETELAVEVGRLLYVSESIDPAGDARVLSLTFAVRALDENAQPMTPTHDAHVTAVAWVPREELADRIEVGVIREPLLAHLRGEEVGYFACPDAGITIRFADDP